MHVQQTEGTTILILVVKEVAQPILLVNVALVFLTVTTKVISDFHSASSVQWTEKKNTSMKKTTADT